MRKSWHQHWMEEAIHASEMSTCAGGRKVGAVFVRDNYLLSTGFNGVPRRYPHPTTCKRKELGYGAGEALHLCPCSHAEVNAICNAARVGVPLVGSVLYCTSKPCIFCMGSVANVEVSEIIYMEDYPNDLAADIAKYASINLKEYKGDNHVYIED